MRQFGEFFINHWDLFLAFAGISALLVWQSLGSRLRGFRDLDPTAAVQLMNHEGAVLVDVREDKEVAEGRAPGALHIPLSAFGSRAAELEKYREKPIIISCRSGHRSSRACGDLRKRGFEAVYNLRGGMLAWQNANLPLTRGGKGKKR